MVKQQQQSLKKTPDKVKKNKKNKKIQKKAMNKFEFPK